MRPAGRGLPGDGLEPVLAGPEHGRVRGGNNRQPLRRGVELSVLRVRVAVAAAVGLTPKRRDEPARSNRGGFSGFTRRRVGPASAPAEPQHRRRGLSDRVVADVRLAVPHDRRVRRFALMSLWKCEFYSA